MNQNILLKNQVTEMQLKLDVEKSWWENKRAQTSSDFMKELEADSKSAATAQRPKTSDSSDDAVLVETGGPADQGSKKKKGKKGAGG